MKTHDLELVLLKTLNSKDRCFPMDYRGEVDAKQELLDTFKDITDPVTMDSIVSVIAKFTMLVKLVKDGKINEAQSQLTRATELLEYLDGDTLAVVECFAAPAIAYVYYSNREYPQAFRVLRSSLSIYDRLLAYNEYFFHCCKLTQLLHLCKISLKSGKSTLGCALSERLAIYISQGTPPGWKGHFSAASIDSIPASIRNAFLLNILMELFTSYLSAQTSNSKNTNLIRACLERVAILLPKESREYQICNSWINLKHLATERRYQEFVDGFHLYAEIATITNFDILSLSLVIDFQRMRKDLGLEDSNLHHNLICQIVNTRLDLPGNLRTLAIKSLNI